MSSPYPNRPFVTFDMDPDGGIQPLLLDSNKFPTTVVDPREFGELDDTGTNDCSDVIQAALDSLRPSSDNPFGVAVGGIVRMPKGKFRIETPLKLYTGIVVEGSYLDTVFVAAHGSTDRGVIEPF